MHFEGPLGCYRVVASETVSLPAMTEIIIPGEVCSPKGEDVKSYEGIIEPIEERSEANSLLTARAVVKTSDTVPVRLMNVTPEVRVVHKGTSLGTVCKIQSVSACEISRSISNRKKTLRPDLRDLLDRSSNNLNESQKLELRQLLIKYEGSFAERQRFRSNQHCETQYKYR